MSETVVKIENLSKNYRNLTAVKNLNLEIQKGEIIGFVGPNGAGKTTTLKLIARVLKPNSGKIFLLNKQGNLQNIFKRSKDLVEIGFLIDIPHFYNTTPYRLLKYIANLKNYPKEKINSRINEFLTKFNLIEWKYKKVHSFSKGMIQKLGFISAIIHDPEIIILDEPQTGLDPKARIAVRKYLKVLQRQGKTIFIASHMLYEISEICDKIALIDKGILLGFDTIENLENMFSTKEILCEIENSLPIEKKDSIIAKLVQKLEPYLENNLDPTISKETVNYIPEKRLINIYYDGNAKSRTNILDILVNDFKTEFTVNSFSNPKISQLERLYTKMITNNENESKTNLK